MFSPSFVVVTEVCIISRKGEVYQDQVVCSRKNAYLLRRGPIKDIFKYQKRSTLENNWSDTVPSSLPFAFSFFRFSSPGQVGQAGQ